MEQKNDQELLAAFAGELRKEEKSRATIEKYLRDARSLLRFLGEDREITKEKIMDYKQYLSENYEITSANSMLAAVNRFLRYLGYDACTVKAFRVQREAFRSGERELTQEEYRRLLTAARKKGQTRLCLLMQTICATGIRISELPFITVEAVRTRRARVFLKGKSRVVLLPVQLCRELARYIREKGIRRGSIFITRSGCPLDRSNILHAMKALCGAAGVERTKVFPHNLRHLFAVTYYKAERDICHLADLLGHSNINTTRIYTRISSREQERQIERLGLVFQRRRKKITT